MTDTTHQINLALRTAAGHARAASDVLATADKTYEMKMKSAGASVWEAWTLAVSSQPEFAGRKLDDRALERIYSSTKARPWWDKHLAAVKIEGKPANREWAMRTMQWHTDPDAARARRAKDRAVSAANYKKIKEKSAAAATAYGRQRPQAGGDHPSTAEMREVRKAAELGMGWASEETGGPQSPSEHTLREIDRLLDRIIRAVKKPLNEVQLAEAEAILQLAAEGLEAL